MAVEIELNRLPDLSEKDHKTNQLSSIPFLSEPCSYDQVIFCVFLYREVRKVIFFPQFFTDYLLKNRPCLLGNWATQSWPCLTDWRGESGPRFFLGFHCCSDFHWILGRLEHILMLVGSDAKVPVTNCDIR